MKPIRWVGLALLLGFVGYAAYAQPPIYDPRPAPPPYDDEYDDDRYDDDRYDDDRYDDDRYDDGRYGDDRYGDDRYGGWSPTPQAEVGFFYDELSPYGDWVLTREYGWAWFPRDVHPYWRPYRDGRWVVTEYGWTWASYEPFGWATYHYGRWTRDPRFGWLWIPGTIWGPAWVSWQHGGGYVGWAPLPPAVGFEFGLGLRLGGFNLSVGLRPESYTFVSERSFLEPRLSTHFVPTVRNVTLVERSTNVTNYTVDQDRVVNRGVDVRRIEQATGRRVRPRRLAGATARAQTEVAETEVRIYRPERRRLDSVRVGRRANAGMRAEAPPPAPAAQRPAERRNAPEVEVAPRTDRSPRVDARQLERRESREREELQQFQAEERRRVERLQRQETAGAAAEADRAAVQRRHREEREAMEAAAREAEEQLRARQRAERRAAVAEPPGRNAPPADDPREPRKRKKKEKGEDDGSNGGNG